MHIKPSLITRIAIGKGVGLVVGLAGFLTMPHIWPESGNMIRWGILLWYITVGAVVGVFGVFTWHPVLHLPMPWWFRAPVIGAWMNFVLVFFAYDAMATLLEMLFGPGSLMTSPFWFVLEGAVIGWIMGFFATWFGGEGPETVSHTVQP